MGAMRNTKCVCDVAVYSYYYIVRPSLLVKFIAAYSVALLLNNHKRLA